MQDAMSHQTPQHDHHHHRATSNGGERGHEKSAEKQENETPPGEVNEGAEAVPERAEDAAG